LSYKANYFVKNGDLVGPIKRSLYKDHPLNHSKATIPKLGSFPPYSTQHKKFLSKKEKQAWKSKTLAKNLKREKSFR